MGTHKTEDDSNIPIILSWLKEASKRPNVQV